MNQYKGYLIDLDGTMYRGSERIEAAGRFVKRLHDQSIPYLFVTNNSTKKQEDVAEVLSHHNIIADPSMIVTTSMATASYIHDQKPNATVYAVGEEGLFHALRETGHIVTDQPEADFVVIGLDRAVTYEKLARACLAVRNGATFISTNGDVALPTERGLLPGNGSITSVVTVSTGQQPIFIGKPESVITEQALKIIQLQKEEVVMVGDNYDTDILAGINAGIDTLLVFTGVTQKEHLSKYQVQPTYTIDSLDDWN
ncbi:TIGR01457 family HAD-type hydrolase [Bacillaceae bacterium S4-13-58]